MDAKERAVVGALGDQSSTRPTSSARSTTCIGAVSKTSPILLKTSRSPDRTSVPTAPLRAPPRALSFTSMPAFSSGPAHARPLWRLAVKALASWMATLASSETGIRSFTTSPLTTPFGPQW